MRTPASARQRLTAAGASAIAAATIATAIGLTGAAATTARDTWPGGPHDAGATSYNAGEHHINPTTVKHLIKKWHRANISSVAALGTTLYAAQPGGIFTYKISNGHKKKHLVHLGGASGTPSQPLLGGGRLVTSYQSTLYGFKTSNGKRAWAVKEHDHGAIGHQWASVSFDGKTVYAILVTSNSIKSTSTTKLQAFAASSGHLLWSRAGVDGPLAAGHGLVFGQVLGPSLGPGSYQRGVNAYNATTGATAWAAPYFMTSIQHATGITVSGGTVVVTAGGYIGGNDIAAVSATTGAGIWGYHDTSGNVAPSGVAIVTDGTVVTYISSQDKLISLDLATGKKNWKTHLEENGAIGGGGVVYGLDDTGGRMHAFRLSDGKSVWTGPRLVARPALVTHGRMIAVDTNGTGADGFGVK